MRHPIEGTPYVPPPCPVWSVGDMPDLRAAGFRLLINVSPDHPSELYGTFESPELNEEGELVAEVLTDSIHLPLEDPIVETVRQLIRVKPDGLVSDDLTSRESPAVERMRLAFCERVANCQGVIDGECWALGQTAVEEVIEQALSENETGQ